MRKHVEESVATGAAAGRGSVEANTVKPLSKNPGAVQSEAVDRTIAEARLRFEAVYGALPYLVGEEIPRSYASVEAEARRRRTVNFDGVFTYLHSANLKNDVDAMIPTAVIPLDSWYTNNQVRLLRTTYEAMRELRNRFTGLPILVIPSLSTGFAKPGFPTLQVSRRSYSDFIDVLTRVHTDEYTATVRRYIGGHILPTPVYSVGSWNEEFEGHAVFPSSWNLALRETQQGGFDLPMAIKQAFGWNHYAGRDVWMDRYLEV